MKTVSDSQSPLLPVDNSSRYGSRNTDNNDLTTISSGGRRLSVDSYSNYPLSLYAANKDTGRSSSFLNLANAPVSSKLHNSNNHMLNQQHHRRNPSLPSSPIRDNTLGSTSGSAVGGGQLHHHKHSTFSPAATPLLDFTTLTARNTVIGTTPSPSTSTSASAYDYHAAQLERFLEEYRNLQDQLCKMKETCDSIRKKDNSSAAQALMHRSGLLGQSAKFADPVMFTTAAALNSSGSPVSLLTDDDTAAAAAAAGSGSANPKGILKNKSFVPGQPPDPPPYWLHRNAILKRLQDPAAADDFFQS